MMQQIKKLLNKITRNILNRLKKKKNNKLFKKRIKVINREGKLIVQEIENCLKNSGLIYFATCGTLLGLIRENKLLKNDYDMDYAILIRDQNDWKTLSEVLEKIGYEEIREFSLEDRITEKTYRSKNGIEIDFFGHFIENDVLCFYSYDKLSDVEYPSEDAWTAYVLKNGKYKGIKKIMTDIGEVTVPFNAEEYLTYNYNDDWMTPDPNFRANTGKGCMKLENLFGKIKWK